MPPVIDLPRDHNPFSMTGVSRDRDGIPRYDDLPATLLDMLAGHVEQRPDNEAVVELGAGRLTYRQLWDRAARGGADCGRPVCDPVTGSRCAIPRESTGCWHSGAR